MYSCDFSFNGCHKTGVDSLDCKLCPDYLPKPTHLTAAFHHMAGIAITIKRIGHLEPNNMATIILCISQAANLGHLHLSIKCLDRK